MKVIGWAALLLGGCVAAVPVEVPVGGGGRCDASKVQSLVGQVLTEEMQRSALATSGSRSLRVIPPNTAVTTDYREDRLNIETDAAGKVTGVKCG